MTTVKSGFKQAALPIGAIISVQEVILQVRPQTRLIDSFCSHARPFLPLLRESEYNDPRKDLLLPAPKMTSTRKDVGYPQPASEYRHPSKSVSDSEWC